MNRFRCVHNHPECSGVPLGNCSKEERHRIPQPATGLRSRRGQGVDEPIPPGSYNAEVESVILDIDDDGKQRLTTVYKLRGPRQPGSAIGTYVGRAEHTITELPPERQVAIVEDPADCPSPRMAGRQDRCGLFSFPKRCQSPQECSATDAIAGWESSKRPEGRH